MNISVGDIVFRPGDEWRCRVTRVYGLHIDLEEIEGPNPRRYVHQDWWRYTRVARPEMIAGIDAARAVKARIKAKYAGRMEELLTPSVSLPPSPRKPLQKRAKTKHKTHRRKVTR